jgi:MFS transporter, ACS family, glucarate transporter
MKTPYPTRVRYGVLLFACSLSLITYLDRFCISRVAPDIRSALTLSKEEMGWVFAAFALGYAMLEVPGGWLGDVWGSRRTLTVIVLWWSAFTALTGLVWAFSWDTGIRLPWGSGVVPVLVTGVAAMCLVRFLFGCGEAGAYPNLARVTKTWFPLRQRGFVQGSIWTTARLGGAVAPLVIGRLAVWVGWRPAFWALGCLGLAWCVCWWLWFRDRPEEVAACNDAERELIREGAPPVVEHGHPKAPWGRMLASPTMWAMCVASFGISFGWYFFPTWYPTFLKEVHHIDFADSEILTGLPMLFGACGAFAAGWLSDWLVRVTGSRRWGRMLPAVVGFSGAGLCVLLTGFAPTWWLAVALLCGATFVNDLAIPPFWAACTDVGGRFSGTVSGVMNTSGALGAALGPLLIPYLQRWFGYVDPAAAGGVGGTTAVALLGEAVGWRGVFMVLASAWFVAAAAWLFINADRPLVPEENGPAGDQPAT